MLCMGTKLISALFFHNLWLLFPGPEVIKYFPRSTQLSMEFQMLIKTEIPTNEEVSCFKSLRCCINHAYKCLNCQQLLVF